MRFPRLTVTVAVVVCASALAACGGGGGGGDDDNADATAPSISDETPTAFAEPDQAAQCLFDAWIADDAPAASACADDIAIDELFAQPGEAAAATMTSQGCFEEEPLFRCAWTYEGGSLGMLVVASEAYGWRVSDIEYVAD